MTTSEDGQAPAPAARRAFRHMPDGYRQGLVTAITVLLGFSLAFVRFWGFEAPGQWKLLSLVSAGASFVAIAFQLFALFRALRPEDDDETEYRKTVRWFLAGVVVLIVGLLLSIVDASTG